MDLIYALGRIQFASKVLIFCLIWLFETWRPLFPLFLKGRLRHAVRNISIAIINISLFGFWLKTVTTYLCDWAASKQFGLLHFLELGPWVETILALVLIDGLMYFFHRANHSFPLLWRIHRMHHTDLALDVTSASRFHPGEVFLGTVLRSAFIPIIGLHFGHYLLYEIILMPIIMFHHSNVALPEKWDSKLRWLIVTPRMHWVHHSELKNETDSNFASVFSFWDRLNRTFNWRPDPEKIRYGLEDKLVCKNQTIVEMLKTPLL